MASPDCPRPLDQGRSLGQWGACPLMPPSSTGCSWMTFGLCCCSPARPGTRPHYSFVCLRPSVRFRLFQPLPCGPGLAFDYGWHHRPRRAPFIPIVHHTCQAHERGSVTRSTFPCWPTSPLTLYLHRSRVCCGSQSTLRVSSGCTLPGLSLNFPFDRFELLTIFMSSYDRPGPHSGG